MIKNIECPNCGSTEICRGQFVIDEYPAYLKCKCFKCDTHFRELYGLTHLRTEIHTEDALPSPMALAPVSNACSPVDPLDPEGKTADIQREIEENFSEIFELPAIRAWHKLKKLFTRYNIHMNISAEYSRGDCSLDDEQVGIVWNMNVDGVYYSIGDYDADDEPAEYYTITADMCTPEYIQEKKSDLAEPPAPIILKILKALHNILQGEDQISFSYTNIYVHNVPMIGLPHGLDKSSFEGECPLKPKKKVQLNERT